MTTKDTQKLAQEVGIQKEILDQWMQEFKLPLPEKYQRNALQVLKLVKELKDKNCGYNTIQRQIQLDYPELQPGQTDLQYAFTPQEEAQVDDLNSYFSSLRSELLELGEMAEKYAQANYSIGQMSIQLRQLEEDNNRLRTQLKLLPSPEEWKGLQEREITYRNLIQGLHQRIKILEEQVREQGQDTSVRSDQPLQSLPELPPAEQDKRQLKLPFQID